jgi:ABC-type proline/glycine betaine transport system substrate-binding protein
MNISAVAIAAALALACAAPAFASGKETADAEAQVRAIGKRWDGEVLSKTTRLYVPLLSRRGT